MESVYSVSKVNHYISGIFEGDYLLHRLSVKGEVSNCKYHSSGHIYFTLKDENSSLSAVMFRSDRGGLSFRLEDGMQVVVSGSIGVYEKNGSYQLYAKQIRMDGVGELYRRYEQLKNELEEMGMFADEYKKQIPHYVKKLGVVTAPTGAAVHDIIQIAKRRYPMIEILLYPAKVQGDGAAESICKGIRTLDGKADCIIVGRGGGSIEDLWAFNERIVAEEIFNCETPLISAVGHETDFTIADFVADLRAPTPSAAAELAVFSYEDLMNSLADRKKDFSSAMENQIVRKRAALTGLSEKLAKKSPSSKLYEEKMRLADGQGDLGRLMKEAVEKRRQSGNVLRAKLSDLSPAKRLSGGYAFVENAKGQPVRSVQDVSVEEELKITTRDGAIYASVDQTEGKGA